MRQTGEAKPRLILIIAAIVILAAAGGLGLYLLGSQESWLPTPAGPAVLGQARTIGDLKIGTGPLRYATSYDFTATAGGEKITKLAGPGNFFVFINIRASTQGAYHSLDTSQFRLVNANGTRLQPLTPVGDSYLNLVSPITPRNPVAGDLLFETIMYDDLTKLVYTGAGGETLEWKVDRVTRLPYFTASIDLADADVAAAPSGAYAISAAWMPESDRRHLLGPWNISLLFYGSDGKQTDSLFCYSTDLISADIGQRYGGRGVFAGGTPASVSVLYSRNDLGMRIESNKVDINFVGTEDGG